MNQNETAKCDKCQNVNKVLVSTGHNKPENKGKKYFTCAGCGQFQWVPGMATQQEITATEHKYDSEAEGKVRHGVIVAMIQHGGIESLKGNKTKIEKVVDYIMTGKFLEE